MKVSEACEVLRACNDAFGARREPKIPSLEATAAVGTLKAYLERARDGGKPISELEIAERLLFTPEGMRWVMPFVLSAESMIANERATPLI